MKKLMFAVAMAAAMTASAEFVMYRPKGTNPSENWAGSALKVADGSRIYAVYLGSNLTEEQAAAKATQLWTDVQSQAAFDAYEKLGANGGANDAKVTKLTDSSFMFDTMRGTIQGADEANAYFSVVLLDTENSVAWVGNAFKYDTKSQYLPGFGGYAPARVGDPDPFHTVSTTVVPEPTSALLMLLGMAGLALRRKQA